MAVTGIGEELTARRAGTRETSNVLDRPAVIISGSCSDSRFVPAEVLICADALSAEAAIRAWLEAHGIRVAG
jgi:hypothetical protein